ncbi:MAG: glycerate kinase [Clostridia bacterium]|nr:glycerate kinase [Clostridia bacterium]
MNIVIAIDSFKGSLTSFEAGNAIKKGILNAMPKAKVEVCPIADGGEGTVDAICEATGATLRRLTVRGPLGEPTEAYYGILDGKIAVMEMAKASGLPLIPADKRNPMYTTTYGVGEMIYDAIRLGCREFIIGIGGSATNDGGIGMLQALGFELLDRDGVNVPYGALGVGIINSIHTENAVKELKECTFHIACDVTNPLCGPLGCSEIFSRQKGADDETVRIMDSYLDRYASMTAEAVGTDNRNARGAGAAGGLGFAFISYLNGSLENGSALINRLARLEDKIKKADIVVTGEGRLDSQTAMGKAPCGVAEIGVKYGVPVIALSGSVADGAEACNSKGIVAFFPILREICTLEKALNTEYASKNLEKTAEQIFRLIQIKPRECR